LPPGGGTVKQIGLPSHRSIEIVGAWLKDLSARSHEILSSSDLASMSLLCWKKYIPGPTPAHRHARQDRIKSSGTRIQFPSPAVPGRLHINENQESRLTAAASLSQSTRLHDRGRSGNELSSSRYIVRLKPKSQCFAISTKVVLFLRDRSTGAPSPLEVC